MSVVTFERGRGGIVLPWSETPPIFREANDFGTKVWVLDGFVLGEDGWQKMVRARTTAAALRGPNPAAD